MIRTRRPAIWFPAIRAGSGADSFTVQLAKALNKKGIRAEITWLPHRVEYAPWTVPRIQAPPWASIAHVNTWLPYRFFPRNIPTVATLHHCVQNKEFYPYKTTLQRIYHHLWITPMERRIVDNAVHLISVSNFTAQCAEEVFKCQRPRTIYNGVDTEVFRPLQRKKGSQSFRLIFIGNRTARKGFDLLPTIMQELGDKFELFYTLGRSEKIPNLPRNMHSLPHLQTAEDMANAYNSADVLLMPSRLEGFGLVAAEAMSCGLPVIASRVSALPEVVQHGLTGLLCAQGDIAAFVTAVRELANNQILRHEMSQRARAIVVRDFNLNRMVNQYIEIYEKTI